jgi:transcription antitermination factor NusG
VLTEPRVVKVRAFQVSATPAHFGRFDFVDDSPPKDVPLEPEHRSEPPVIDPQDQAGWYALTVGPHGERRLFEQLRDADQVAYSPMQTLWVPAVRKTQRVRVETQRPILPGYVFARIPTGSRLWFDLRRQHRDGQRVFPVRGVVTNHGRPCRIQPRLLAQLATEERDGWFDERRRSKLIADQRPELAGPTFRAGERVGITAGAFANHEGVAQADCASGAVRTLIKVFGGETVVVVPIGQTENRSREMAGSDLGALPLQRASDLTGLSDLARSQGQVVGWRNLEQERLRRVHRNIFVQGAGKRPVKQHA